ncbi:MAG: carotenoid biosynthesis protein [Candidatus Lokiarchaeota archaeon]|nr:carotenoid biosynthesis protein [Candidatus Harpocratesius repetitus]
MWLELFEWMIVIIYLFTVIGLILNKNGIVLSELIGGTLFGLMLEYLNIALFHGYTYHVGFLFQIGNPPNNVPIVIGLAWGLLGITTSELSERFQIPEILQILMSVILAVSYDLFLDVIVIRLEGGFWVWGGFAIDWTINSEALFGIPWGNFIGWFFVMFYFGLFRKIGRKFLKDINWKQNLIRIFAIPILSDGLLLFTFFLIGILGLHHYGAILFLILFLGSFISVISFIIIKHPSIHYVKQSFSLFFWISIYVYLIVISLIMNYWSQIPIYLSFCMILIIGTIILDLLSIKKNKKHDDSKK